MARVLLKNVWKKYGRVEAVKNLNLTCGDGEFLALLGPSGCGKSSTLRMIAGLEQITAGEIYIDSQIVNYLRPRERNIAMAFETYALYPTLSVFDNIAFPLKIRGLPASQIKEKVVEFSRALEIADILDHRPRQLSGGQQQRIGLARALVREPSVFLLDEPISHLDVGQRRRMRIFLKRLHHLLHSSMIYVTHDQEEAMALADRIAIMNEGILQQIGTPDEVFNHPANEFVADFVGEPPMNFIDGEIGGRNGKAMLFTSNFSIELPEDVITKWTDQKIGRKVKVGIRPMHISIDKEKTEDYLAAGEVYIVESTGEFTIVTVKMGKELIQVIVSPDFKVKRGERVWLKFLKERIHLFGYRNGKALLSL